MTAGDLSEFFPSVNCEPPGRREAPPDDRLREAIQGRAKTARVALDCFVANAPRNDGAYAGRSAGSPRKPVAST
jgi:hypothetical protein